MILFLAGTSDARALALEIKHAGYGLLTTVVTENAANELKKQGLTVTVGRLTSEDFKKMVVNQGIAAIVDASHPFAEEASRNAMAAANERNIPYIRYERESQVFEDEKLTIVSSYEEAANVAYRKKGVIMLTTGSKTLEIFARKLLGVQGIRVIARMLPRQDNMEKCAKLGFPQKDMIMIQGPFSKYFDKALYQHYGVTTMVTKESGKVGSVDEKLEAAKELGIETVLIKRPSIEYGTKFSSFQDVIRHLAEIFPNNERRQTSGLQNRI
ncbi:precorrin-6A reductase [Mesobacillus zeae]|uniref:Precorrin-6A reductase n=1 Tax=Mesobacillus zeae TaxID=1917180 RepID=A0A398B8L9_9BACI|nr:precorrin-6A reductase [Mesobacillus zeae]RID86325.1 precorrin-6A reductase [Mesobacillus zeae]